MDPVNLQAKFKIRSFTRSIPSEQNRVQNFGVPGYAHAAFSAKFLMRFCLDGPC